MRRKVTSFEMNSNCLNPHPHFSPDSVKLHVSPTGPTEPSHRRPTFDNIKWEFDTVAEQLGPGDLFLLHFSGHGVRLPQSKLQMRYKDVSRS
ncbi:hypothetical protein B0J13DRAFT_578768 [Dactylonectria estremocensis]|uniref:Uncharacterized protein n=1 Tax=Dactylonectria estremocensis TaxID=1079267 RepID=A0A9P9I6L3_9HYPO|nr:hypothetical protein B0J13DRAFT_578768 [Dactylonectria estremocensis]